jgi:hypothetical protein
MNRLSGPGVRGMFAALSSPESSLISRARFGGGDVEVVAHTAYEVQSALVATRDRVGDLSVIGARDQPAGQEELACQRIRHGL